MDTILLYALICYQIFPVHTQITAPSNFLKLEQMKRVWIFSLVYHFLSFILVRVDDGEAGIALRFKTSLNERRFLITMPSHVNCVVYAKQSFSRDSLVIECVYC